MQYGARSVYETMQKEGLSGRELEAQVLTRAANVLKDCQDLWEKEGHKERLDTAIRFNQKVWSFFQAELVEPDNPLPQEIKQNILTLSIYIDSRLLDILIDPNPDKLTIVININRNLAAGLMEKPKSDATAPAAPATVVVAA